MTKYYKWEGILGVVLTAGLSAWIAIAPPSSQNPWVESVGVFLFIGGLLFVSVARSFYYYGQIKGNVQPDARLIEADKRSAQRSAIRARKRLARLDP